jgi:anti-sigma regulatory factor (Ser/Thr protein kinase)
MRHRVVQAAREAGAAGPVLDEIALCVGEAVANAASHAYDDDRGTIAVFVQSDALSLTVTVRDRGSGLESRADATAPASPEAYGARGEGSGFGLRIIRALARDVSMWSLPGQGTVMRMRFSLEAPRTRRSAQVRRRAPS